ncbi:MAG: hypothetical protein ACRD0Z_04950 [Acidimicrobiales bacterium]
MGHYDKQAGGSVNFQPMVIVAIVGAAVLVCVLTALLKQRPSPRTAALFAQAHSIGASPAAVELAWRYLDRARRYRFFSAWAGLLLGVVVGHWWWLIGAPAGWFAGVLLAELFRLRRGGTGPKTASLTPRLARKYMPKRLAWHTRALLAALLIMAACCPLLPWHPPIHLTEVTVMVACGVWVLAEACQRAIAARTRPALPPDLEAADDAIRRVGAMAIGFASSGILALLTALALAFTFAYQTARTVVVGGRVRVYASHPYAGWHTFGELGRVALIVWALALVVAQHQVFWPPVVRSRMKAGIRNLVHPSP